MPESRGRLSHVSGFTSSSTAHSLPHEQQLRASSSEGLGPGGYSPEKHNEPMQNRTFNKLNLAGQANFGTFSKSRSEITGLLSTGDPGEYTLNDSREIAKTSRHATSKAAKLGMAQFGAKSARVLRHEGTGFKPQCTPGPAAYQVQTDEKGREWQLSAMADGERMQSAVFASKVERTSSATLLPSINNPGPGAYDPDDRITIEHLPGANPDNNPMSKMGRDKRYTGDTMVNNRGAGGPEVGPGSYDPMVTMDGTKDTIAKRSDHQKSVGWTASFISGHLRDLWQGWFGGANDEAMSA